LAWLIAIRHETEGSKEGTVSQGKDGICSPLDQLIGIENCTKKKKKGHLQVEFKKAIR
jgi:hypothetical protein